MEPTQPQAEPQAQSAVPVQPAESEQTAPASKKITKEQFFAVELRVGKILAAERVPETDKLIKCTVDLGEVEPRTIVSGLAGTFPDPAVLVGRQFPYVANLEPRKIKGIESNGMILAVSVPPTEELPNGSIHVFDVPLTVKPGTLLS